MGGAPATWLGAGMIVVRSTPVPRQIKENLEPLAFGFGNELVPTAPQFEIHLVGDPCQGYVLPHERIESWRSLAFPAR